MSLLKTLRDVVFEEDAGAEARHDAKPAASPPESTPTATTHAFVPDADDDTYKTLVQKTSFEATDVGRIIWKYLSTMESLPLDQSLKFKTAITQANKLDGVTDDAVLATFDTMKSALDVEHRRFEEASARFKTAEIDDRQARLSALTTEIDERQRQVSQITAELSQAQANIARIASQFTAAADRRSHEIEQERSRFAALLKG